MAAASFVPDLEAYIASFNRADWETIGNQVLDERTKVYVDGKLVAEGREKMKPSYLLDFDRKRQVKIVGTPQPVDTEGGARGEVSIKVRLSFQDGKASSASPPTQVDAIYTYNVQSRRQVRHEIFLEKSSAATDTAWPKSRDA
jgi:hypothetical protein